MMSAASSTRMRRNTRTRMRLRLMMRTRMRMKDQRSSLVRGPAAKLQELLRLPLLLPRWPQKRPDRSGKDAYGRRLAVSRPCCRRKQLTREKSRRSMKPPLLLLLLRWLKMTHTLLLVTMERTRNGSKAARRERAQRRMQCQL